jgi:hypothetical protein
LAQYGDELEESFLWLNLATAGYIQAKTKPYLAKSPCDVYNSQVFFFLFFWGQFSDVAQVAMIHWKI